MPRHAKALLLTFVVIAFAATAWSHFQALVPGTDTVSKPTEAKVALDVLFTHPMEAGPVMNMDTPAQFGVLRDGKKTDLLDTLQAYKVGEATAYKTTYQVKEPGDHVFYIEPAPYWEPAEGKYIVHYTKVVVDAYGAEEGWDAMVGFPVEIEPLVRPYGLWTGNVFRGVVRKDGKPVPFAEIEVEYHNADKSIEPPADSFVTQVIKADANGTFCYAMPRAGWWAFAALVEADAKRLAPDGKTKVPTELGALMWVRTVDMK